MSVSPPLFENNGINIMAQIYSCIHAAQCNALICRNIEIIC